MTLKEYQQVLRIEQVIQEYLIPVMFIDTYCDKGDMFAEIYDLDDNTISEFNVTELATEIVRELNGA